MLSFLLKCPSAHLLPTLILLVTTCGCGSNTPSAVVSGKVTYKGTPVTQGLVGFLAKGSPPIGTSLRPDGTYEIELPVGDYQVRVDTPPPMPAGWKEGDPLPLNLVRQVPEKYASFSNSGLTASVSEQESTKTLDLAIP